MEGFDSWLENPQQFYKNIAGNSEGNIEYVRKLAFAPAVFC